MIAENLARVQTKIRDVCRKLGRNLDEITLIGVTKYADSAHIKEAILAGLTHIGENKVQEAQKKFPELKDLNRPITRHMIGHLQTNKVKYIFDLFDLIQTVDSLKLAQEINEQAKKRQKNVEVLIEVNTSAEEQKFGVKPQDTLSLVEGMSKLPNLRLRGLMTMASHSEDQRAVRQCFKDLRNLFENVSRKFTGASNITMKYLSMGMSDDFEIALEEGSNMVRIGRAIFTPTPAPTFTVGTGSECRPPKERRSDQEAP